MPTFTTRFLNVTTAVAKGDFELAEVAERLNRAKPSHVYLEGGWASVEDAQSNIGVLNAVPPESDVWLLDAEGDYPERLVARYYYFSERRGLREARPDASDLELHEVAAIDVAISKVREGEFLLLVSTRDASAARKHPLKKLALILESLDHTASIDLMQSPLRLPGSDLYLWLMVKARDSSLIDAHTEIRGIEAVHGQDSSYRVTVLNDAVSFDRPGFLIAVAEGDELGPAKITLFDSQVNVRICFNLWASGSFSVITGSTYYPDIMDTATWRLQSVFDLAYKLIPRVVGAYEQDTTWVGARADEIRAAAEALVARYSA